MRYALAILGLLALGACTPPAQPVNDSNLNRFIEPTDGAAYSQGDARYYNSESPPYSGGGGRMVHGK
ncbi:MAG TPA: hypothetical protein VIJ42_17200 [Stellaceae bacterium]